MVLTNLLTAFPGESLNDLKQIRNGFYRHFTDIFIQSVKVLSIRKSKAITRFKISNPEILQDLYIQKKSAIIYGAHVANWEWMAILPLHIQHQFVSFYQKQSNSYFNSLMVLLRQRFGTICIESTYGFKALKRYADDGIPTLSFIIGDQRPKSFSSVRNAQFFGMDTPFLAGADRMAQKLGQQVLYAYMKETKRGYYEIEFVLLNDSQSYFEQYVRLLEQNIREQPEQYLWSHKRWKGLIDYN